ncbi:MAG: ribonuclease III [Acidimicrobiia bacterium]|nr:ribonuclease III [Acidimicrobiia bacterium]
MQQRLGHRFASPELLAQALTHRSWCAEHDGFESNERLEFLGDAVLGLVVTNHLFALRPELAEGEMAKARAAVVSAVALAAVAPELGLGSALRLGRGEESTGGRAKQSILADALEAVIGALYLDGGWPPVEDLVLALLADRLGAATDDPGLGDYKTRLQEYVAQRSDAALRYAIDETGPDHAKRFTARVLLDGIELGAGAGRSKKEAQQAAAAVAFTELEAQGLADGAERLVGSDAE